MILRFIPVAFVIVWAMGCGMSLKDTLATVSLDACAGVKVTNESGEFDVQWNVQACAKADALGLPLPELCFETGTALEEPVISDGGHP